MRVVLVFLLIGLGEVYVLHGQNLVPNPSFEVSGDCPGGFLQRPSEFRVDGWRPVSLGTPDYFHACSTGQADVPYNWAGISDAYAGEGYIGIFAWMDDDVHYREFAACRLTAPLIRDSTYLIEFHYKLSSYSKFCIDRMGILLTDTLFMRKTDRAPNLEPTLHALEDSIMTVRTGSWETAHWEYRARGGEQFLTLGNFYDNDVTRACEIQYRAIQEPMLAASAYYFLDDIQVIPKYQVSAMPLVEGVADFHAGEVAMDTRYVLRNIQFEFDSYKLRYSSFDELDALARYLQRHKGVSVQLSGHTDDVGGDRYNEKLSLRRAESVAGYLRLQGIDGSRIGVEGYGKSRPLVGGSTDAVRETNRRVEIRFTN